MPVNRDMYEAAIDLFDTIKELAPDMAALNRAMYDAHTDQGFTEEQALEIIYAQQKPIS